MQIKIAFKAIFLVDGGILADGAAKCTPKRHERFGDPAEQDSQWQHKDSQRVTLRGGTSKRKYPNGIRDNGRTVGLVNARVRRATV